MELQHELAEKDNENPIKHTVSRRGGGKNQNQRAEPKPKQQQSTKSWAMQQCPPAYLLLPPCPPPRKRPQHLRHTSIAFSLRLEDSNFSRFCKFFLNTSYHLQVLLSSCCKQCYRKLSAQLPQLQCCGLEQSRLGPCWRSVPTRIC